MTHKIDANKLFKNIVDLWIKPEIKRREKGGWLSKDFKLKAAQVLFSMDRGYVKVNLNKEVKGVVKAKVNTSVKKGDPVYETDINSIDKIDLYPIKNAGHITLINLNGNWHFQFDFIYNKKRIRQHIGAAEEFYESAKENLKKKRLRPFFDNAFSCAELVAKATLLQIPDTEILTGKKHKIRMEKFGKWAELGNVKAEHSALLNRLWSLRSSARYITSDNEYMKEDPNKIVEVLNDMIQKLKGEF